MRLLLPAVQSARTTFTVGGKGMSRACQETNTPWDKDSLDRFFQRFAPHGNGVERALASVPEAPELNRRLARVYAAAGPSINRGLRWFSVLEPVHEVDVGAAARDYLAALARLAPVVGDSELDYQMLYLTEVEFAPIGDNDDMTIPHLTVLQSIGRWFRRRSHSSTEGNRFLRCMWEAYFSIAVDEELAYYLMWPAVGLAPLDPFAPYFSIWASGYDHVFTDDGIRLWRA